MSPYELPVGYLLLALSMTVGILLFAFRNRPQVRAYLGLPLRRASAAEEVLADQFEDELAAAADRDGFDAHVDEALAIANSPRPARPLYGWCIPCKELLAFCCAFHAAEHVLGHQHDFAAWEQEVRSS